MSGHTKWHQIRRSKGVVDQRRGQRFTKLARDIAIAAREGGSGDPDMNFRLRLAIDKAKANNMPNDGIQRAIDRGTGKNSDGTVEETIFYEGYAPGGVALLIEAATDNRNRTAADVRSTMTKAGANPGEPGSVAWMFEQKGFIVVELGEGQDAEEVMLLAIDAGAEDVEAGDGTLEVYTPWTELNAVRQALSDADLKVTEAEMTMRPTTMIDVAGEDSDRLIRLFEKLEDLDDVQRVYSNADITLDN